MGEKTNIRLTQQSLLVLQLLLESQKRELSGADIMREAGLFSGTLYPILLRFEDAGLVSSRWEKADPRKLGRPRKRLYKISGLGMRVAREALSDFRSVSNVWKPA